jgi:hypothetical protein
MAVISADPSVLALQNTVERIDVTIQDANVNPPVIVDPYQLKLQVVDIGGTQLFTDTWPGSTRVQRISTGKFYIDFGDQSNNNETNVPTEWVFNWKVTLVSGGEQTNMIQKVKVISVRTASLIPDLRQIIDKSRKLVDLSNDCFLGYTDSQLVHYLEGGLNTINAYQPSLVFTMDTFPLQYKQILLDAALITGVMSQELYAIDTDIPSYSDQGTSFVITHQAQLSSFLNALVNRLDKLIPQMKMQLLQSGAMHIQAGPNYRFNTLVQSGPSGATFRGISFRW